jgi:hypothetical protein
MRAVAGGGTVRIATDRRCVAAFSKGASAERKLLWQKDFFAVFVTIHR